MVRAGYAAHHKFLVVDLSSKWFILLQQVRQNVALLSVLPCQTPVATLHQSSHFLPSFSRSGNTAIVPLLTNCAAHFGQRLAACLLTTLSTANLLIEPHAFEMPPCMRILLLSPNRNGLTSLMIASAPSLTLNPPCCSCGSTTR